VVLCRGDRGTRHQRPLDADHEERAIYVVDGEVEIANERYEGPRLLIFRPGDRITVKAVKPTRMMFLGGDALEGPRHIWWNFVSSSKERIEQAKQDWKTGRFAPVPNEHESFASGVTNHPIFLFPPRVSRADDCLRKVRAHDTMLASDLAPSADRARQGSRHLCRRRHPRAAARHRRISAFDVVMAETIPMKGAVLTQISAWWFNRLEAVVPHHMISADADTISARFRC